MPDEKREQTRIALLIVIAVLAIALAMLEALADNPPTAAIAAPSRFAPSTLSPVPTASGPAADESVYPGLSDRSSE